MIISGLKKKIDSHKIISFDIFDTAIFRNTSKASEVFEILEKNIGMPFLKDRVKREKIVKEKLNKKSVTIEDIYSENFFDKKIMNMEIDIEKSILQINKEIKEVYDYAIEKNKRIIFISDMYLNSKILTDILKEKGYENFDRVFSSCDYNLIKSDGSLFEYAIKTLKCNSKEILHIGDSFKSDYLEARKKGIDSIYYRRRKNKNISNNLEKNLLNEFCYNNCQNNDYFYRFGYEKFGILLYSFSLWLKQELNKRNIKKVFFLSRDGFILKKAFDLINDSISTKYLYVSRRSLTVPNLWKNSDYKTLDKNITVSNYFTIETFLKRLGEKPEKYSEVIKKYNLNLKDELNKKSFLDNKNLEEFYNDIKKNIVENSKEEYKLLKEYLNSNSFYGKIAIVDIGWHGTMQKNLSKMTDGSSTNIYGFYLGQEKIIENATGFLFNEFDNPLNKISLAGSFGLFESLFLGNHGSVIKYQYRNNSIDPVLDEYELNNEKQSYEIINNIQNGAIDFCREFSKNKFMEKMNYNETFFEGVRQVCINPSLKDVKNIGQLMFNDTYNQKLVESRSLLYYLFHPSSFKRDFYKSVWKIGFLKRVFKINISYFKFYYNYKSKEMR